MYEGNDDKYIIGFNNFALTINHNINPHCVKYILMLSEISQQIKKKLKPAVFQVSFSSSDLLSIIIPLPNTRFEQDYIVSILSNVDAKIENDLHIIQELDSLKKGLMSDLLTGRLRVKVN
jgi:type I restriction enzyme S subunit